MGSHYTSIMMNNTNSLMRLSNRATDSTLKLASSLNDGYSRPSSLDDLYNHQNRSYVYGRKSSNMGPLTLSSTLEDNGDGEYKEEHGATPPHLIVMLPCLREMESFGMILLLHCTTKVR